MQNNMVQIQTNHDVAKELIAKAQVKKNEGNKFIVWVKIYIKDTEVFRGKFVLITIDEKKREMT